MNQAGSMVEPALLQVEVVYALPQQQWLWTVSLPSGATAMEAVRASGLAEILPASEMDDLELGIYARRVEPQQVLRQGDRVEIYRPLPRDPMHARRVRAGKG